MNASENLNLSIEFLLLAYLGVMLHFRGSVNNLKRIMMQKYMLFFRNKCRFCSVDGNLSICNQLILLTQCSLIQLPHKLTKHLGQKRKKSQNKNLLGVLRLPSIAFGSVYLHAEQLIPVLTSSALARPCTYVTEIWASLLIIKLVYLMDFKKI